MLSTAASANVKQGIWFLVVVQVYHCRDEVGVWFLMRLTHICVV